MTAKLVVNLDYPLTKKERSFLITKTLIIRCYTIKCNLRLYSLQQNIMDYIIALIHNSLSQSNIKRTTYIIV